MRKKRNRYRSDKRRRWTIRGGIKALFRLACLVSLVVCLSAAFAHSYHVLLEAPWLKVSQADISGLKHVQRNDILNIMGVACGSNVLNLKTSDIASRLESQPWIKSAEVKLDLPGRLVVDITEREPIAVVAADELLYLDGEGKLFARTNLGENPGLLLVTGFAGQQLKQGDVMPWEPLQELQELLPALKRAQSWLPVQDIVECQWRKSEGFVLFVTQRAVPVELGLDDQQEKMERLGRIFGMLKERQWIDHVGRIDLDFPDRAYVVLARSS